MRSRADRAAGAESGAAMLEVLVTVVIVATGLLGVAGLQARMHSAEMEGYQRTQATILLQSLADQLSTRRRDALSYVTAEPLGAGRPVQDCSAEQGPARDLCEWNNRLLGAAEATGGQNVGAMIGARGCVTNLEPAMPRKFMVAVVWQGLAPTAAPAATTCGRGLYGDDRMRRAIVEYVTIGCLQNDVNSGTCVTP